MAYGPTHELNPEEKDLVWKFRHHLSRDKRVDIFRHCVPRSASKNPV
jgi:hypothetical protein